MTTDEAKDILIETCQSPMQMDMAQMTPSLEKWGFKITDYERMSDSTEVLQQYMVWLECSYGVELMKRNVIVWLEGLKEWPWTGQWTFVVDFYIPNMPKGEWTFEIVKFNEGGWSVRKTDACPKWPTGDIKWRLKLPPMREGFYAE
jgi:hypothetical protein